MTVSYFGTGVTLGVYIDFDAGVTDTPASWTDVTADVRLDQPILTNRGRSSERGVFQTGSLGLSLDNRKTPRLYDPENAAGAYYGKLLPGRPIKVEVTYAASTEIKFSGFIQGWPQSWEPSDNDSVVSIVAHDLFKYLALAQMADSRHEVEVETDTPTAWYRLGDADDSAVCADSSGNGRHGQYPGGLYSLGTLASSVVELSADGSRTITGTSDTSKQVVATNLHYLSGTTWSWEAWVRIPSDSDTSGYNDVPQTLYIQSTGPLGFGVVTALTTEPIMTLAGIRIRIVRSAGPFLFLDCRLSDWAGAPGDPVNTYDARYVISGLVDDGDRHHICYTFNAGTLTLYIDGVARSFTTTTGTASSLATFYGTNTWLGAIKRGAWYFDEVALYSTTLSGARVLAHYEAGSTAAAGETIAERITTTLTDAGVTWVATSLEASQILTRGADYSGRNLLPYLQALEASEQGRLFVAGDGTLTFYNNAHDIGSSVVAAFTDAAGGSLPYAAAEHEFDDTRVINDATVSRVNGTPQRSTDTASRDTYGLRSVAIDGLQVQSDSVAKSIADYLVTRYADPAPRIRALVIKPRANVAGLFPAVRDLEIGDKVTFRRAPLGGTAFTKTLTVEGISHSISASGEWVTTLLTAPSDATELARWDEGLWDQGKWGI